MVRLPAALLLLTVLAACGARPTADDRTPSVDPAVSPHPPHGAPTAADERCRQRWVDQVQLKGENGNPGGSQGALDARWDRFDREARAFADRASAVDCGAVYTDLVRRWDGVQRLQYDLQEVDMAHRLKGLEGDRRHYLTFHQLPDRDDELPDGVAGEFRDLRREAPLAQQDLQEVLDAAGADDVTDRSAVAAYKARVRRVALASTHLRTALELVSEIEDAELDEE